ncbi:MAG TPA: hypothetical protein DEB06_06415 [Phycisphaerales bacterium]|nr:hypothetical protein [Phycisphaerales bacterium]
MRTIALSTLALLAGAALLGGCQGHGKYTGEFKENAELRVSQMKAATEWDMARQQFLSGDLEKALRSIDRSLTMDDTVAKSHVLRGRILLELSRLEPALQSLERAGELKPEDAEAFYYAGIVYERISRPEQAFEAYMKAQKNDPTDPQFPLAAAEMLVEQGKLAEAEAMLTDSSASFQHNAGIRQTLGHIALLRGDTARAVVLFNEATLLGPGDAALREDLARAQMSAGRFADAETGLRWILDQPEGKDRRDLVHLRARCLIELDKPVEARAILLGLVRDESGGSDTASWIELGNVSLMLNDQSRLRECAQRLMSAAPGQPEGYLFLALWQRGRGEPDKAVATLSRAIAVDKTSAGPALLQGVILQDLGRGAEAARAFRIALKRDPSNAQARALLAGVAPASAVAEAVEPE